MNTKDTLLSRIATLDYHLSQLKETVEQGQSSWPVEGAVLRNNGNDKLLWAKPWKDPVTSVADTTITNLQKEVDRLYNLNEHLKRDCHEFRVQAKDRQHQVETLEHAVKSLGDECARLTSEKQDLQHDLRIKEQQVTNQFNTIKQLQEDLDIKTKHYTLLEGFHKNEVAQNIKNEKSNQHLRVQVATLQEELAICRRTLDNVSRGTRIDNYVCTAEERKFLDMIQNSLKIV